MAQWDESKHKRDDDGKFTEQNSQKAYQEEVAKAILKDKGISSDHMQGNQMIERYNELICKTGRYDRQSGKKVHITKMHIQLFAAKLSDDSEKELCKSRRSYKKVIDIHKEKISNPKKYIENWEQKTQQEQNGLINYWKKEIIEAERRLKEIKEILDEPNK